MSRPTPDLPDEAAQRNGPAPRFDDEPLAKAICATRRLIDLLGASDAPDEVLEREALVLEEIADRIEATAEPGKRMRMPPDPSAHPQGFFPSSPMSGWANPLALPISIWAVDEEDGPVVRGRAIFPLTYEGPPTCVHGGMIALLFDEILGTANLVAGRPGMTGTLSVRYRRPTPLLIPLELEARQIRVDGRKIITEATISVDGEVTASAEAIFIEVPPAQMLGIIGGNAERAGDAVIDKTMRQVLEDRAAAGESY